MTTTLRARVLSAPTPDTVTWIDDARVAWDDAGRLVAVEPWTGGPWDADVRHGVLTPGFVDVHVHYPQWRIVGAASGDLLDWLARSTFPEEARFADADHATAVAHAFCRGLAAAGTTTALVYGASILGSTDRLFEALDAAGLKAVAGPVLMDEDAPAALLSPPEAALADLERLVARWHGHDGRLAVAVIPRFALSCSRRLMAGAAELARRHGLITTTHLAENPAECAAVEARFGTGYLQVYEDAGLVHDRCVLAHGVHLDDAAWSRLARAGAVLAHCPEANAFLGSGDMPVEAVLRHGVRWALGTDLAGGRSVRLARVASAAHDNALRRGVRIAPGAWLHRATRAGALALGRADTGDVAVGHDADLVLHDVPAWVDDAEGALAAIVHRHDAPPVTRTWVRGRVVWERPWPAEAWPW